MLADPAVLADRPISHALVLGGSGFLGAPLVQRLIGAGIRTTCLVHRRPITLEGTRPVRGALDRFPWRALEQDPPDVVFHLARIPGRGGLRGVVTRARNRWANTRMALGLAALARPPLVVFVGGTLAYGSHGDDLVTEQTPLEPISFSRDYHRAERPWLRAQRHSDVPVIIARPAWVLGRGAWFEAFYRRFIAAERAVPLYGPGDNWMSIVHVDDSAGLLLHAARRAPPGAAVNVFTHAPLRQAELAERLARITSLPMRRVSLDDLERRLGRAVREAFTFSARIGTVHQALHAAYRVAHPNLDSDLAALLAG